MTATRNDGKGLPCRKRLTAPGQKPARLPTHNSDGPNLAFETLEIVEQLSGKVITENGHVVKLRIPRIGMDFHVSHWKDQAFFWIHLVRGRAHSIAGSLDLALHEIEVAIGVLNRSITSRNEDNDEVIKNAYKAYREKRIKILSGALPLRAAYMARADIYIAKREFQRAIDDFQRALATPPMKALKSDGIFVWRFPGFDVPISDEAIRIRISSTRGAMNTRERERER